MLAMLQSASGLTAHPRVRRRLKAASSHVEISLTEPGETVQYRFQSETAAWGETATE